MVKSWTGIAVGILKDKGYIKSETELYCKYVPEWEAGCKKDITIKHLLNMSSGLRRIKDPGESILAADDVNKFALKQQPDSEPGNKFAYSNEGAQLLGILIEKASGMAASDFYNK